MPLEVKIHVGSATHRFEAVSDRSLLDQAIEAGIAVNFSCKRGDCGQCVGTLVSGDTMPLIASQPSRIQSDIYLCNAAACSNVEIQLPYFPELADIPTLRSPAKIHELNRLSADVVELALRLPPAVNFKFLPGQFIRLTNKERVTRSYSIAAPMDASKLIRIHVRQVDGGVFSDYLFSNAKPGELLQMEGPHGHFFLRQGQEVSKTIFLATGTGIAPIHAILSALNADQSQKLGEVDVYWGNRFSADEYLRERMQALAADVGFRYWPLHSREVTDRGPRHVQDLMASHHSSLAGASVYACGSSSMINAARQTCLDLGLTIDRFHSDPFTSS